MTLPELTPSQVTKAGRTLRRAMRGEMPEHEQISTALDVLLAFRAAHQRPLTTANMGLRSMVKTAGCSGDISQRLKRVPTILDKLKREPTLALARMQDIGGCRAVLASIAEVRLVESRLRKNRRHPPVATSDYITDPRESGYRGVHVVVNYAGRNIEVQLRTKVMHEWAITVERLSGRRSENFKGDGSHPVQQLLKIISLAMALEEEGGTVDTAILEEMDRLRAQAAPYLGGTR